MTLATPTLFDTAVAIARPMIVGVDSPRARRTDPTTSHAAADQSQRLMHDTKLHVMQVLHVNPNTVGSELNDLYRFMGSRKDWNKVAFDSPRKRASELVADGYVDVVGTRTASNGTEQSVYALSEKGLRVVTLGLGE
jgi:hypothetical protein